MANRTVRTNDIAPDTYGFVRGTVTWSHIASHIEGEELEREIERAQSKGRIATENGPYTRINIDNAAIVDYLGNLKPEATYTPMDIYLKESMYVHNNGQGGWAFTGRDKRRTALPDVYEMTGPQSMNQIMLSPDQELAQGSDVIVVMQCYKPRTPGFNNGVSMRAVIVVGNPSFRQSQGDFQSFASYLAQQGVTVNPAQATAAPAQMAVQPVEAPQATQPAPSWMGAAQIAQTPAPQPAPQQMQPQQAPWAAPAQAPQAPTPAWAQPQQQNAAAPQVHPQANPFSYTPPQTADPAQQMPSYPPIQPGQGLNPPIDETAF